MKNFKILLFKAVSKEYANLQELELMGDYTIEEIEKQEGRYEALYDLLKASNLEEEYFNWKYVKK